VESYGLLVVLVAIAVGLAYQVRRDSHWSAPDGRRFTCFIQEIAVAADPLGERRWYPARATITDRGVEVVRIGVGQPSGSRWYEFSRTMAARVGGSRAPTVPLRPEGYEVRAEADRPPRRTAVFLLDDALAVRVPEKSPAAAALRRRLAQPNA
jgi:hypothetical protein